MTWFACLPILYISDAECQLLVIVTDLSKACAVDVAVEEVSTKISKKLDGGLVGQRRN